MNELLKLTDIVDHMTLFTSWIFIRQTDLSEIVLDTMVSNKNKTNLFVLDTSVRFNRFI